MDEQQYIDNQAPGHGNRPSALSSSEGQLRLSIPMTSMQSFFFTG